MINLSKFILGLLLLSPLVSSAAVVSVEPRGSEPQLGDTAIFDVYLNTEGETINTIDGSLRLVDQNRLFFRNYFMAGSVFSLWPSPPNFKLQDRSVSFVGGVPGGLKTNHGLLFSLVFSAEKVGDINFRFSSTTVYLNDGKAAAVIARTQDLGLSIAQNNSGAKNNWQELIKNDRIPPKPFSLSLYQDPNLFNGQKFISFMTSDDETGVAYYEVKEGEFLPERAETNYVLQNQEVVEPIEVRAYDQAGNLRVEKLGTVWNQKFLLLIFGLILLVLVVFGFIINKCWR